MDVLWLTPQQARQIGNAARDSAPEETCGVIGGRGVQACQIIPTPNVAADPAHYFEIAPNALVHAMTQLQADSLDVIGFYHSHPQGLPVPSRSDIALATYPDTAMLIVGLAHGEPELAAWCVTHGIADRMTLHVSTEPPPDDSALGKAQMIAIVLSAALAVAAFLAISLTLLPPAPAIP